MDAFSAVAAKDGQVDQTDSTAVKQFFRMVVPTLPFQTRHAFLGRQ